MRFTKYTHNGGGRGFTFSTSNFFGPWRKIFFPYLELFSLSNTKCGSLANYIFSILNFFGPRRKFFSLYHKHFLRHEYKILVSRELYFLYLEPLWSFENKFFSLSQTFFFISNIKCQFHVTFSFSISNFFGPRRNFLFSISNFFSPSR